MKEKTFAIILNLYKKKLGVFTLVSNIYSFRFLVIGNFNTQRCVEVLCFRGPFFKEKQDFEILSFP